MKTIIARNGKGKSHYVYSCEGWAKGKFHAWCGSGYYVTRSAFIDAANVECKRCQKIVAASERRKELQSGKAPANPKDFTCRSEP